MLNTIKWHIGCSGFHYKEWKEVFYPKGLATSKWFVYYSNHMNTLESNVSFYRFPRLPMLQKWYNDSPDGFSFSVKAPQLITHFKKFIDCSSLLLDFYGTIREGLKDKLGCVLFQLPPSYSYSTERLNSICAQLDPSFTNVVEFRQRDWWNEDVYAKLAEHHISFSGISHPTLPEKVICNTDVAYYRFHGVPDLYKSPYSHEFLHKVIDSICGCSQAKEAYLYFNNTMNVAAVEHVKYLQAETNRHPCHQP